MREKLESYKSESKLLSLLYIMDCIPCCLQHVTIQISHIICCHCSDFYNNAIIILPTVALPLCLCLIVVHLFQYPYPYPYPYTSYFCPIRPFTHYPGSWFHPSPIILSSIITLLSILLVFIPLDNIWFIPLSIVPCPLPIVYCPLSIPLFVLSSPLFVTILLPPLLLRVMMLQPMIQSIMQSIAPTTKPYNRLIHVPLLLFHQSYFFSLFQNILSFSDFLQWHVVVGRDDVNDKWLWLCGWVDGLCMSMVVIGVPLLLVFFVYSGVFDRFEDCLKMKILHSLIHS